MCLAVFAQLCGLKDPLTTEEPETDHGRVVSMAVAIAASGVTSVGRLSSQRVRREPTASSC